MKIYRNIQDTPTVIYDAPETKGCIHKATLMKEEFVRVEFETMQYIEFLAGDSVSLSGDSTEFYLAEDYEPSMKDDITYRYELQFNAPWYNLNKYLFMFLTKDTDGKVIKREIEFNITADASTIIRLIIENTRDIERECPFRFDEMFYCEPTQVKTFNFSSTDVISAFNKLATDFSMEWWVDSQQRLHFGECDNSIVYEGGSVVFLPSGERKRNPNMSKDLTIGGNISAPSVRQREFIPRFMYVYGSSRNIDQTIDPTEINTNALATRRLSLPNNPIDNLNGAGEGTVVFNDVYPKSDYQITGVRSVRQTSDKIIGYDENDQPIYGTYLVYLVKIQAFSDMVMQEIAKEEDVKSIEDIIASGKALSVKFISKTETETKTPKLAGWEFEVRANLEVDERGNRYYEFLLVKQDINDYIVPNEQIKPEVGDWVCVFNIKNKYVNTDEAIEELKKEYRKYISNKHKNVSYTVTRLIGSQLNLVIGDSVRFTNYHTTTRTRVNGFEVQIDGNKATYELCPYITKGAVTALSEEVTVLNAIVEQNSSTSTETIKRVMQEYGDTRYLKKTVPDTANGDITINKGLVANSVKAETTTCTTLSSPNASVEAGMYMAMENGRAVARVDDLTVRGRMNVAELRINKTEAIGGKLLITPAHGTIKHIYDEPNHYTIILEEDAVPFLVGDYLLCQRWDADGNETHFHWTKVTWVDEQRTMFTWDKAVGQSAPQVGDNLVVLGSTNKARQFAVILSGIDSAISVYDGIDSPSLNGKLKCTLGKLNGISNPALGALKGYGLFAENAYLKGKFVMSNGTEIGGAVTRITDGLGNTGINIEDGTITLDADNTIVRKLTATGLKVIYDNGNNKMLINDDGSISQYYPDGKPLKIEEWTKDADGNIIGTMTTYYDQDGNVVWRLGSNGYETKLSEYWLPQELCFVECDSSDTDPEVIADEFANVGIDIRVTTPLQPIGWLSQFRSDADPNKNKDWHKGKKSIEVPKTDDLFTGYIADIPVVPMIEGYQRRLRKVVNGKESDDIIYLTINE